MKNKFITAVMSLVIFGIIGVVIIFAVIIYSEISRSMVVPVTETADFSSSVDDSVTENIRTPEVINDVFSGVNQSNVGTQNTSNFSNVNYDNVSVNKYFYNQLNDYSKTMYKAFESNKENMKTGTYQIELGTSFSEVLNQENGQDLLGQYYQSAIEAYTYDNPDVFYLSPNKMYLNIETTTKNNKNTYSVFINNGNGSNYLIDEFSNKEQVDEAIKKIEQVRNDILNGKTDDDYENIKLIHDYLVDNISYDTSLSKPNIYNIYGALVNNSCVCEGYARSFKYLADYFNIDCTLGIGKGVNSSTGVTENHAWNYVQLNGNWYAIDCTWDDPVTNGASLSQSYKYRYFLKGENDFNKDHQPSGKFTDGGMEFSYPTVSKSNY